MATMDHAIVGSVMISVHGDEPPTKEEWAAYLKDKKHALDTNRLVGEIVYTTGGGPNANQRSSLAEMMSRYSIDLRISIVSNSAVVRGIATAISWKTGQTLRTFNPESIVLATTYAGASRTLEFSYTLDRLCRNVGVRGPSFADLTMGM